MHLVTQCRLKRRCDYPGRVELQARAVALEDPEVLCTTLDICKSDSLSETSLFLMYKIKMVLLGSQSYL